MKSIRNLSIFVLLAGFVFSCTPRHNVEAHIKEIGDDTIIIEYMTMSDLFVSDEPGRDTVYAVNGSFFYDIDYDEPIVVMFFPLKGAVEMHSRQLHPGGKKLELFIKPRDNIYVEGELKDLYLDYYAEGSAINEEFSRLRRDYVEEVSEAVLIEFKIDSLIAEGAPREMINEYFSKRSEVWEIRRKKQMEYILENPGSELSAYLLLRQPLDTLNKYYQHLEGDIREGIFKPGLEKRLTDFRKRTMAEEAREVVTEGAEAPGFILESIEGKQVSLADVGSDFIVLHFWGSWCGPCLQGLPRMKEYYEKYSDIVEFVSVACNDQNERWRETVEEHGTDIWMQLFNDDDIERDVSVMYGVEAYPTKFILDADRTIIGRFRGEGDDFYQKVDELFKTD